MRARVFLLTTIAMIAFAANSLLCRLALQRLTIDAASFSSIRILSGAVALGLIVTVRHSPGRFTGSWFSATALFAYVAAFSFAYNSLTAGIGALLLFAAVQSTMIVWGLVGGERFSGQQWLGFVVACAGLIMLVLPGLSAPPLVGSLLMVSAGVAWGIYSLRGRAETSPVSATASNFLRSVPMTIGLSACCIPWLTIDKTGATCAIISGAITSGMGYVIWYAALTGLTATTAATVQLSAPVLATIGGIFFLGESLSVRFLIAATAVLGGIALVVTRKT
jgi:drug/metabolite transporter (DMT)-like permease